MSGANLFDLSGKVSLVTGAGSGIGRVFCEAMAPWRDILDELKLSSLSAEAIAYVQKRPLCFVYVDGLHTYEAALSDICTTAHCAGIIAVDDIIEWNHAPGSNVDIRRAFDDGAESLHRTPMSHYLCREGYLMPCNLN